MPKRPPLCPVGRGLWAAPQWGFLSLRPLNHRQTREALCWASELDVGEWRRPLPLLCPSSTQKHLPHSLLTPVPPNTALFAAGGQGIFGSISAVTQGSRLALLALQVPQTCYMAHLLHPMLALGCSASIGAH